MQEIAVYKRTAEVCEIFSISKSTLYRYAKEKKDFPRPIKTSPKVTLWNVKAIEEYFKQISMQNEEIAQQQMEKVINAKVENAN